MSRTYKDRPYFVKAAEAMTKGMINHDHTEQRGYWYAPTQFRLINTLNASSEEAVRKLTLELEARDDIEFKTVEKGGDRRYAMWNGDMVLYRRYWTTRQIEFWIKEKPHYYSRQRHSSYCTDAEHYDAKHDIDIRDGKTVSCYPDVPYNWKSYDRKRTSGTNRRAKFGRIRNRYNSGATVEDISTEDDSSSVDVSLQYSRPTWCWDD